MVDAQVVRQCAVDFSRGCDVAATSAATMAYGAGVLTNGPPYVERPNCAEYEVALPVAGLYRFEIEYAAEQARPLRVWVNGALVATEALPQPTGCWAETCQAWGEVGVFAFRAGPNTVLLERDMVFPHLRTLRWTWVGAADAPGPVAAPDRAAGAGAAGHGRVGRLDARGLARVLGLAAGPGAPPAPGRKQAAAQGRAALIGAWIAQADHDPARRALFVWGAPLGDTVLGVEEGTLLYSYPVRVEERSAPDGDWGLRLRYPHDQRLIDLDFDGPVQDGMHVVGEIGDQQALLSFRRSPCDLRLSEVPEPAVAGCTWVRPTGFVLQDAWLAGACVPSRDCHMLMPDALFP